MQNLIFVAKFASSPCASQDMVLFCLGEKSVITVGLYKSCGETIYGQ